jgi:hypothetical protein
LFKAFDDEASLMPDRVAMLIALEKEDPLAT